MNFRSGSSVDQGSLTREGPLFNHLFVPSKSAKSLLISSKSMRKCIPLSTSLTCPDLWKKSANFRLILPAHPPYYAEAAHFPSLHLTFSLVILSQVFQSQMILQMIRSVKKSQKMSSLKNPNETFDGKIF